MARYDKLQVLETINGTGVVPVFYNGSVEISESVLQACYDGGIRAFEFTNRGDFAHEVFGGLVKYASEKLPGMVLGAGSVVDSGTASLFLQLGADFIVGPLFNAEVAKVCNRRQVLYIPGCATPTEIGDAQESGCEVCKVFPGDVLGPAFVKSVKAPMPWSRLMVTGGVKPDRENLEAWFNAGADCVGMGSNLFPKDALSKGEWGRITSLCAGVMEIVNKYKR